MKSRIVEFLNLNGWEEVERNEEFISFGKAGSVAFDVSAESVVVIGESGDIAEFPVSDIGLFALLGYMIQCRILDMAYSWPERKKSKRPTPAKVEELYEKHTKTKWKAFGMVQIAEGEI